MKRIDFHMGLNGDGGDTHDIFYHQRGFDHATAAIDSLDSRGFDCGVLLHGSRAKRLDACRASPGRLFAFAPLSLRALHREPNTTLAHVDDLLNEGMIGIGCLYSYREGYALDHPVIDRVARFAIERGVPIHLECSAPIGDWRPGRVAVPPYEIEDLARRYTDLIIIAASWGGGMWLYELMPELPPLLNNLYYDTACPVDAWDTALLIEVAPKLFALSGSFLLRAGLPGHPCIKRWSKQPSPARSKTAFSAATHSASSIRLGYYLKGRWPRDRSCGSPQLNLLSLSDWRHLCAEGYFANCRQG